MLVPVDGPGLMEMTGDLQGGQAMKQNPDDSRDLTSGAGTQQTGVLGLDDELADGGHGVVGRGVDTVFRDVDGKVTRAYMFMGVN